MVLWRLNLPKNIKEIAPDLINDPSVVEVICPGFAGKLLLSVEILARTTGDEHSHVKALFKTSAATTKDYGKPLTLCVINYSEPFEVGYLDIFTVMFLHCQGVESRYLLELQRDHHNLLKTLETDLTSAKYFLRVDGKKELLAKMDEGMTPEAREMISEIKKKEIRKMQKFKDSPEEMKILVSESREVLRVIDPYNQLQSNECFFVPNLDCMLSYEKERFESAELVLVIPQPCYSASDIQRFNLSRRIKAYEKFKDCIILPSQTEKPFVSRKYIVCWDSCLVLQFNLFPWSSEIPSQVSKFFLGVFQCSNVKSFLLSSRSEDTEVMVSAEAGTSKLGRYLSPSFDWNAKREKIVRLFEDLEKKCENLRPKIEPPSLRKSEESADESSAQDLKGLCTAMSKNLNDFITVTTKKQRKKRFSFQTLE